METGNGTLAQEFLDIATKKVRDIYFTNDLSEQMKYFLLLVFRNCKEKKMTQQRDDHSGFEECEYSKFIDFIACSIVDLRPFKI